MTAEFQERRRAPRVTLAGGYEIRFSIGSRVKLLDISLSGVYLSSPTPAQVGTRAQLRTTLDSAPFVAQIEVRREQSGASASPDGASAFGATFLSLDEKSRWNLEQFLRKATS